jgi:hypothetical protein
MGVRMLHRNLSLSRREVLRLAAAGAGIVETWFHPAPAFGQPGA